ncbi:MAG TPA: hypothetical protein VIM55_06865 [Mucilaginibacter sp.]
MHIKHLYLSVCLVILFTYSSSAQALRAKYRSGDKNTSAWYFTTAFLPGEKVGNIYSRTIAYSGDGFNDLVQRVSGSSVYKVTNDNYLGPEFEETDLYDGRPAATGHSIIGRSGQGSYNGKTFMNTSASGLLFSELVWGKLPAKLHEGDSWQVELTQAWELGGPGTQTVTVMQMDAEHHTITLKREGNSEGFFDGDAKQIPITTKDGKKLTADVLPGTAHWTGYTIFKNGVVISDELLVTRPITIKAGDVSWSGNQREYILLNAMPVEQ